MKWRGISFKLFTVTSLVFIGCLTVMMFLQLSFFEPYYVRDKTGGFLESFEKTRQRFLRESPGGETVPPYFAELEEKYYAITAVVSLTVDGNVKISPGKGIGSEDGSFSPFVQFVEAADDRVLVRKQFTSVEMNKLVLTLREWLFDKPEDRDKVLLQNQAVHFFSNVTLPAAPDRRHFTIIAPLQLKDGVGTLMVAVSSLQPVGDAVSAFRGFFPYFYLLAAGCALLLAFLYSRMITKPLVALNKTALRMAKLDFREQSKLRRNDELGSLSDTLNFLSGNLVQALGKLHKANAKLQEDIEREKQLERLRREFVAGVSHELKTPISLIGGYAEALQDNVADGLKRDRYAAIILEEASRMAGIVNDMLDLSQLETGQYRLQLHDFRIDKTVEQVAERLQSHKSEGAGRIELRLLPVTVLADRFRIEQVLSNLLSNALRHTPDEGRLGVRIEHAMKHSDIRITVWNEGERIPEAELAQIWEHFYRVEKSRERVTGGTGIGLAIVRQIVQLHGGHYSVRNTADGVEFSFTLRMADQERF